MTIETENLRIAMEVEENSLIEGFRHIADAHTRRMVVELVRALATQNGRSEQPAPD